VHVPRREGDRSCICLSWVSTSIGRWSVMYLFIMGIHIDRKVIGHVSVYHGYPTKTGRWSDRSCICLSWVSYQDRKVIGHVSVYHGYPTKTGRWSVMYLFIMSIHIDRKVIGDVSVYHGSTLTLFLRISEKRQFPKLCKKSKLYSWLEHVYMP
jgi:uncharacterized paraquat-inducible protein A